MKSILLFIFFIIFSAACVAQNDTAQHVINGRKNSVTQQAKPYVILISADGFRYDYATKYNTKNLLELSNNGVRSESMVPSFPSLTFPNHYSIITGLYPSHHGIVNNTFYDAKRKEIYKPNNKKMVEDGTWYGGTPLWVLAENQQMLTASFYWVASEAPVKGVLPTYFYRYNESIPIEKRIQTVSDWLRLPEEQRPHFITFYFPEVDHDGHIFGPDAVETEKAVQVLDSSIGKLVEAVNATGLPVNFIFVSDHGMTYVDTENMLQLPAGIDTAKFIIPADGTLVEMYAKDKKDILPAYRLLKREEDQYTVYLKSNVPKSWHYRNTDDRFNRIGDILIEPFWPHVFNLRKGKTDIGKHGYDPKIVKDMHAVFYAWGPAFKTGMEIPSFNNLHVYPMIAELLGLKIMEQIDGQKIVLHQLLQQQ